MGLANKHFEQYKMKLILLLSIFMLISSATKLPKGNEGIFISITPQNEICKADAVIVELKFTNNTKDKVRLLDKFENPLIFITATLKNKKTGTFFYALRGGKAAFHSSEVFNYINISPRKNYKKELNLSSMSKTQGFTFTPGTYTLKMSYMNQYGEDCLRGRYYSNEIDITITQ